MTPADLSRRVRKELKLTQSQLGLLLGSTQPTVCRWERGQWTPPDHQLALLEAFARSKVKNLAGLVQRHGVIYALTRVFRSMHPL